MVIPKENTELMVRYAREIGVPPRVLFTEYEKIFNSGQFQKCDETARHAEVMKEVKNKIVDLAKLKRYRKGLLPPSL